MASIGLDEEVNSIVTLISGDNQRFDISKDIAYKSSQLINTMIDGDSTVAEIPLPNVKGNVLHKIIEYMNYHCDKPVTEIEKPIRSNNISEIVCPFDADFVQIDDELLFDLILAANYMDMKPLLDLTCATVASFMKNKTAEEIRKRFNIENDLSPEEEAMIHEENKWAEEN